MPLPHVPADVKFDAVSGDYYPIIYFNDYWNLQKDYYPINESLASLPLRVSFCPLSLWRWQLYAAQSTKSPWNFLGDELYEQSDEEQDSVKVRRDGGFPAPSWAAGGEGEVGPPAAWGPPARAPCPVSQPPGPPPQQAPGWLWGSCLRGFHGPPCHPCHSFCVGSARPFRSGPVPPALPPPVFLTLGSDSESLLPLTASLNIFCSHLSLGRRLCPGDSAVSPWACLRC